MVKHLKPPKCPKETSQRLPKLKYFSLTTWRFNMLPTVQSWAWRGESVDVLEGFRKQDETYGMRCMKIYATREQQHGCHWLFKCFYICRKYIQRLGIYAMILMEHPLRKPGCNAETSKSTHVHSWIFSKKIASSGPTVTSHKHLKMFQLVCLPCVTNWCCKLKNQVQIQAENSKSNLTVWRIWLPEILHLLVTQRILDALSLHLIPLGDVFMLHLLRLDGAMTHDLTNKCKRCMYIYKILHITNHYTKW